MKKIIGIVFLGLLFCNTSFADSLRVVDGDTIVLNGEKIRFSGIDTPELKQINKILTRFSMKNFKKTYETLMRFQSIPINTIKLTPINNQKTDVNSSFLMLNRIAINTKILILTNIQKKVVSVII